MKGVLMYTIGLLCCVLLLGVLPVAGEEKIYDEVIRLHVLANSDSEEDQANKLAVRDAILAAYREELAVASKAEAEERVASLLPAIKQLAEQTLMAQGAPAPVTVTFSDEVYPERVYGELHFPAGTYRSLRVLIGEGSGQNWWCVLFPPLCVGAATEEVAVSPPENTVDTMGKSAWHLVSQSGEYQIRFRVLEWLMGH
jgi:stage II sporulation protein R